MKVLIIPSWYIQEDNPISGVFFREQALALKKQGLDVIVAYPEIKNIKNIVKTKKIFSNKYINDEGMPTYRCLSSLYIPRVISTYLYMYKKITFKLIDDIISKHGKPDVIHAHSIVYAGWVSSEVSRKYNIPLVITEHSTMYSRGLVQKYQEPLIIHALESANQIICVGPGLKNDIQKYTKKEIQVIPNIVDVKKVNSSSFVDKADNDTKFIFFSLGLLTKKKGMDTLIHSFNEFLKQVNNKNDFLLWIGGEGEERINLENLVKEYGLENSVLFLGSLSREQVFTKMNECNVFVLVSRHETFGVVFIEALAAGKPIIATKSGGPDEIVTHENGLLVEIDNIQDIQKSMLQMYKNYDFYNKTQIINDCIERFSEEAVCTKLIAIYQNVIESEKV